MRQREIGSVVCAGLVGLKGCSALRRECEPSIRLASAGRDEARGPAVQSAPQLIPVVVTAEPDAVVTQPSAATAAIEIDLAGKYRVRVSSGVDAQALRRVLDVLERR